MLSKVFLIEIFFIQQFLDIMLFPNLSQYDIKLFSFFFWFYYLWLFIDYFVILINQILNSIFLCMQLSFFFSFFLHISYLFPYFITFFIFLCVCAFFLILCRPVEERNEMEKLTFASLAHLPTAVIFVIDPTGLSGEKSTLAAQLNVRKHLKERFPKRPWLDVVSKGE